MSEEVLLGRKGLQEALGLKGLSGKLGSGLLYRALGLEYLNRKYPEVSYLDGPDFSKAVLERLEIPYEFLQEQLEYIPSEGGFITVSNHPFGGADGLILNALVGSRREDYKILTTFLLSKVSNLSDWFIPVDNFSTGGTRSITGIRTALEHLAGGGALGLFPAGEVSTWQEKEFRTAVTGDRVVEDKLWADNIVKLIKNSGLPVVPIYFDGDNSKIFHMLGRIHPMLRTVRLVRELSGRKGSNIKIRIGKPVPPDVMADMDIPALGRYLRNRCYALEAQCVSSVKDASKTEMSPLADPVDPKLVRAQIGRLDDKILFQAGDYREYLIDAADAPDAMRELYRLREETFRSVGEGTGCPLDTDSFDSYYKHLILWNIPNGEIVGSYRVGYGSDIVSRFGKEGLYTSSLIKYGPDSDALLPHCMELGRSFIACKYQREVLPLKLMLSGLTVAMTKDPESTCCTGTVSISNKLPDLYKSLAVYYLERDYKLEEDFASPTHPFEPDFMRVNPEDLLARIPKHDIDSLDKLLGAMSDGKYRLPVLLRKYFCCGARVACFNVDPLFCNSLDGMIVLKVKDFPVQMLKSIVRPLSKEMQEAVFEHFYGTSNPE